MLSKLRVLFPCGRACVYFGALRFRKFENFSLRSTASLRRAFQVPEISDGAVGGLSKVVGGISSVAHREDSPDVRI